MLPFKWCFPSQRSSCPTRSCTKPWTSGQHKRILFLPTLSSSHLRQAKKKKKIDGPHNGANYHFLSSSECLQDYQTKRMIFVSDFGEGSLLRTETKEQYSNGFTNAPSTLTPTFHSGPQSGLTVSIIIKPFKLTSTKTTGENHRPGERFCVCLD